MLDQYVRFFATGASASGAFIGLLFVAFAFLSGDDPQHATREGRAVLAGSAFLALVDVFFVCLVSLFGGSVVFATANVVMAGVGLLGTSRLLRRAKRAGVLACGFPKRKLHLVFAAVAFTLFSV
jgi:hypothetical protein